MKFISYAQNLEDVLLWRAFKSIALGIYIDIGVNEPTENNTTKGFYDLGWRGINVVENVDICDKFSNMRPRDVNLNMPVDEQGKLLDNICKTYVNYEIHFLRLGASDKINKILKSSSFEKYRPWIIVINHDMSDSDAHLVTEEKKLLVERRYEFLFFDGLNQFYVANEKASLFKDIFKAPVNFLDNYQSYQYKKIMDDNLIMHKKISMLEKELDDTYQEIYESYRHNAVMAVENNNMVIRLSKFGMPLKLPSKSSSPASTNNTLRKMAKIILKPIALLMQKMLYLLRRSLEA